MGTNISGTKPTRLPTTSSTTALPNSRATDSNARQHASSLAAQHTFTPTTSGDPEAVNAARQLLPPLQQTINRTGSLYEQVSQGNLPPSVPGAYSNNMLWNVYTPDANAFPGLAQQEGPRGVSNLLNFLNSNGMRLQIGGSSAGSGVSDVVGFPGSTDDSGTFGMISRGYRGDQPYTTFEVIDYESTSKGPRITGQRIAEDITGHVPSTDPRLQRHVEQATEAK